MKNVNKKKLFMTIGISSSIALAAVAPKAIDVFASDFNRTGSGSVNASSSGVKPLVADDKVKAVPNGEKNFNATVALTTEAGLGSGTLINEDTIVTVAHNFVHLNTKSNPISVENNVNKSGDVHIATLPNGKQVRFSNDDVKFWNRDGFVNGFKNDLAVIKLRNKFTGETPVTVSSNVASLKAADTIHVFGFPKGKLQPILNGKVESVENYGANIMGVAYQGSAPGMSGGGLYNAQGELIGVHQNGVEGVRSGGISFSKEQLDWVNATARGENAQPVYLKDEPREDDKDKESEHGKLIETDNQSRIGWIGELYEDGTYVMKGVPGKNVELNNTNAKLNTMFAGEIGLFDKLSKIKKVIVDGKLVADRFDVASIFDLNEMDLTGLSLTDKAETPLLIYKSKNLTKLKLDKNFKLNSDSSLLRMIDGAPNLKLTNEQVTQLLSDLALTVKQYDGPLIRNVGVERLDLSTFDNSKIDPTTYSEYSSHALDGNAFTTKSVFKDLIGLKEVVFGDKFDFTKYGSKSTKNAFLDTDLSGVERVTFAGSKRGNNKFIDDWLTDVKKLNDKNKQGLYHDGQYVGTIADAIKLDKTYEDGVYTLGPIEIKIKKPSIEFKEHRIRINDSYELSDRPYLIVDETTDMKIDDDPGLAAALNNVKGHSEQEERARENIKKLMAYKTGKVFKVKSYEEDGTEGWRYFRTWTSDVNIPGRAGLTKIPHEAHDWFEKNIGDDVRYSSEDSMVVGRARGKMIAYESYGNIGMVTWTMHEPSAPGEVPQPNEPDFPHGDGKVATVYERYEGDTHIRSNEMSATYGTEYKFVNIGTKPTIKEEIIERRSVKYRANLDLGVEEKVIQEGSDKVKKTIMKYTLKKESDKRSDVKSLLKETEFDVPKDSKLLPTVENGGIEVTTSEEFIELKDKIIEKRVPKDSQKEESIAPKVVYQKDDTREKGQTDIRVEGVAGKKVTPIKYDVNPNTGEVIQVPGEPVITPAKDTIIKVAAKTRTKYVANDEDIIKETTEYSVNPDTSEVTSKVTREISNAGGAKKVAEVTKTPSPKKYVKDDTREKGQPDIVEKGQDGEVIYEFPMIVDENTGEVTKGKPVLVKDTKPTDTIVKVAAKDKVVTEEIQPDVIYERDDTRDYGTPNVEIKGELGKKAITTEYTVNEKTGEVTENVKEPVITPAGVTRIKVGTRKRVETIRKDGNVIERLTEYELDSKTGKITEKITEKLLSSNGNVPAPVLDIPEYTGVLSGNEIDENGNQITPPVLDVPEYKGVLSSNGIDENGNVIQPPVLDVPEFKGGVTPSDAPTVDVPEYKGEIKKPKEPQQTTTQEVTQPEKPQQTTTTQKEEAKPKLPKTNAESIVGLTATGLLATIGAAFAKLRKKK